MKTFTPAEVQSGAMQIWLQTVYTAYSARTCQTATIVIQQTVQQTVNQAVQQAAQSAATQAASAAAG
jgi:spore coat protein CotF